MTDRDEDKIREERIQNEIIVDCYGEYEQAAGWHCYLDDMLMFPFEAECIGARSISPLKKGEHVRVIRMADQNDCLSEMFVMVEFMERTFGVPLAQLKPIKVGAQTQEAVEDWHYWVGQGHSF